MIDNFGAIDISVSRGNQLSQLVHLDTYMYVHMHIDWYIYVYICYNIKNKIF